MRTALAGGVPVVSAADVQAYGQRLPRRFLEMTVFYLRSPGMLSGGLFNSTGDRLMKKFLYTLPFLTVLLAAPAQSEPFTFGNGNAYASIGAGVAIPQDTSVSVSGSITGTGKLGYKDGLALTGSLGYHFNPYLAGEAELAWSRVDYDHLNGTLTAGLLGAGSGSVGVNGHASAFIGLLNGIVKPFGDLRVTPYIGAGVGLAATKSVINSESFQGATATVNSSENKTHFAMDGLAGFDIPVQKGFSVGGRYQYLWINSKETYTSGGLTEKDGNFGASVITAKATFHF